VQRGYHSHLMKGKFPIALLYVTVDPALVDVNVHPAKAELRFQYAQEVQNALVYAIREALRDGNWASANPPIKTVDSLPDDFDLALPQNPADDEVKRTVMRFDAGLPTPSRAPSRVQPSLDLSQGFAETAKEERTTAETRSNAAERFTEPAAMRSTSATAKGASQHATPPAKVETPHSVAKAHDGHERGLKGGSSGGAETAVSSSAGSMPPARSPLESKETSASVPGKPVLVDRSVSGNSGPGVDATKASAHVSKFDRSAQNAATGSTSPGLKPPTDLRSVTNASAKMQARGTPSAVATLKASVPSPDGQTVIPWNDLQFVGSFARCFLLFEYQQQMLAIDQHAFHERVLYERLVENPDILRRTQPLLMPEVLVFSPTECERLVHMKDALDALGIQIHGISDTEIEVSAVPSLLVSKDLNSLLVAILGGRDKPSELAHDVLATMACHAAVRAGEELPEPELKALLREAESVDFYHNCPHGRRVFRWWKLAQVAAWFDR
nr:hypothetical protein [Pseudobdellovibrionaceae bacterium]